MEGDIIWRQAEGSPRLERHGSAIRRRRPVGIGKIWDDKCVLVI